jgi:serine/threonine protein kinase
MALSSGSKLGPYEILAPIGAGGMGEVYRARDPRMGREVAIKVAAARDPRMGREVAIKVAAEQFSERFSREVHAVAALNHPTFAISTTSGPTTW